MKNKFPAWVVLAVICIVAALLLALTNNVTSGIIAKNEADTANRVRQELLPEADSFEALESGIYVGRDVSGSAVGYIAVSTAQGFGGEIEVTVAANAEGVLNGVSVGGSNFSETSGLGAKAREPEFQSQFAGKTYPLALMKKGGEIDAISGATITSSAVIKAANAAFEAIAAEAGFKITAVSEPESSPVPVESGLLVTGSADGFGGPVAVTLTVSSENTVAALEIGDADFNETESLGARALEPAFAEQFIGKALPVALEDIDAIAGATITTTAVIEAINGAYDTIR